MFVTYLWHYVVGHLIYDELVRPLVHGNVAVFAVAAAGAAVAVYLLGRRTKGR
jgi:hypothetical protein